MGEVLSTMARDIGGREAGRRQQTERLEAAVRARTADLERLRARFEMSASNRRQLIAGIIDELRTPLTIIQGEAEVCLRGGGKTSDVCRDSLARVREAARHTSRIVDDMLLVARQDSGPLRLDLREVDLGLLLASTAASTSPPSTARRSICR